MRTVNQLEDDFWEACACGELARLDEIVPKLADIDVRHPRGWTGLMMACHGGHGGVARRLVEFGADVRASNAKGTTVFMYAKTPVFESGDTTLLQWLLDAGADINALDCHGRSVLDYVSRGTHPGLHEFLVRKGARSGARIDNPSHTYNHSWAHGIH